MTRIDSSLLKMAAGKEIRLEPYHHSARTTELAPEMHLKFDQKKLNSLVIDAAVTNVGHSRLQRRNWISGPIFKLDDQVVQLRFSEDLGHINIWLKLTRRLWVDQKTY